jgi:acetyltransferase
LEQHIVLGDSWRIFVRPIRPDDEDLIRDLLVHVNKEDLRLRFFESIREFSHQFISRLIELDYAQAMAFVAIDEISNEALGVVRLHADSAHETGEYAILLRSNLKGRGLGWSLMQLIIEYARSEGLKRIFGQILQENTVMLKMCRELGFEIKADPQDSGLRDVTLTLESR